jgi:hypothetical protein
MNNLIEKYLDTKKLSWELTSLKSERARLLANAHHMKLGPQEHYLKLKDTHGAYTIKTIFKRLAHFETQMLGTTKYRDFLKTHRNLFKHAYEKEKIEIGFEEAVLRIKSIKDPSIRAKAIQLIQSGSRWSESFTIDAKGVVTGKGRKRRKLYNVAPVDFPYSYSTFLRKLKKATGLKPHSLRKLFATRALAIGLSLPELMTVMGWESVETATSYLQSRKEEELGNTLRNMVG